MLYYRLADEQLQSETGPPQIVSVQARLLQCYYLLARGRINQCWTTFGSVVSLIYSLGLHRKHREEEYPNLIDFECQKRVFWAAFCLDKFLTYALDDRPPRIELDNTDQVSKLLICQQLICHTLCCAKLFSHCLVGQLTPFLWESLQLD